MSIRLPIGTALLFTLLAGAAAAQDELTYQGRLLEAGAPANGTANFRVELHTTASGGVAEDAVTVSGVPVIDGLFQLEAGLDPASFDGRPLWLEIEVSMPAGAPFVPLTPRQPVNAAPYALYSFETAGGPWQLQPSGISYSSGSVGVGTAAPQARLHVAGSAGGMTANFNNQLYVNDSIDFVGVGRNDRQSSNEVFGVYRPGAGFGGMYVRTDATGLPFYGYAIGTGAGSIRAYTTYEPGAQRWRLWMDGDRVIVEEDTGDMGVGTNDPAARLHAETDGVTALRAEHTNGNFAYFANNTYAGVASHNNGNLAQLAGPTYGIRCYHGSTNNQGYLASFNYGAFGRHDANGNFGYLGSANYGAYGSNGANFGYLGGSVGAYGEHDNGNFGSLGQINAGVSGGSPAGGSGLLGLSTIGVFGNSTSAAGVGGYFQATGGGTALIADGLARVDVLEIVGGADLAEPFDIGGSTTIEPGMVVCIDPDNGGALLVSGRPYDRTVAGVVSGAGGVNPGMVMRQADSVADGQHPVALTGRVHVRCDTSNGPIRPGDLLTTAATPGHAMKVTDHTRAQGAVIGKAMTALEAGEGLVLVLVSLQ